jgi:ribonuclease P/MRP protein subunit RPP1
MLSKASDLGYRLVGVTLPSRATQAHLRSLKKICADFRLDFASRIDLTPRSSEELLQTLRRFRRKFELVSVNCCSKSVARQAAKDHRVDLLAFQSTNPRERFFDEAEARLASNSFAALEVDMALLLRTVDSERARLLSSLRKEITIAKKLDVPVVLSSNASDPYQLRGPHGFAALATLFGMNMASALNAISVTPSTMVKQNREKLDENYVARGIRVLRRGRDRDE